MRKSAVHTDLTPLGRYRRHRDAVIVAAYEKGLPLASISHAFVISKSLVCHVVKRAAKSKPGDPTDGQVQ